MWQFQDTDKLYHHGIMGMKWGVRRYQNADGSLTPAGRKRVNKIETQYNKLTGKKLKSKSDNKPSSKPKPKTRRDMTVDELRTKTNRMNAEMDYSRTVSKYNETYNSKKKSLPKRFVESLGKDVIIPGFKEAGKEITKNFISREGTKLLNDLTTKKKK